MEIKKGFYTALGTPTDENGNLVEASLIKHINQQIDAGASGLLLMGSMGIEAFLKNSTYADVVKVGVKAVGGRVPLFVGAMDTSIARVMEKIETIGDKEIAGIVITAPYYGTIDDEQAFNWFTTIADKSPYPIYLYDLAVAVKYKINMGLISKLVKHKNIKGIKTADWEMIQAIGRKFPDDDFKCFYSGLDSFDYANMMGIDKNLDGMFACTPKNGRKMYDCIEKKDFEGARKYLDNILLLRDTMLKYRLMSCFSYCMNLLGCEGNFHQDFCLLPNEEGKAAVRDVMKKIGEI
ncbi:MAG: dihydrodipicolinate synthase family protein [Clostridia bacterium]|nr:dihydrodipicolinate synthase family protein [Clostridia bacterium]